MQEQGAEHALTEEREFAQRLEALSPRTWVVWGIVALNVAVWLLSVAVGSDRMQGTTAVLFDLGGNSAWSVQNGEPWRLLTNTFLHAGFLHILMNMAGLWATGPVVERLYGHRLFLLIYTASALAGSAASLYFSAQKSVSVGASGAVFGVAGALLVSVYHHRKALPGLFGKQTLGGVGFFVAYSLMQGFASSRVDNGAHVGGLLAGAVLALVLPQRLDLDRFRRTVNLRSAMAVLCLGAVTFAAVALSPRATYDMGKGFVAGARFERGVKEMVAAVQELQADSDAVKAGKMTAVASDERGRAVHAPRLAKVLEELKDAGLPAGDTRLAVAADYQRFVELLVEGLAMESNVVNGRPEPVNPVRARQIEAELMVVNARIVKEIERLNASKKR